MKKSKSKTKKMAAVKRGAKKNKREKENQKSKYERRTEFLKKKNYEIFKEEVEIRKILESRPK